MVLLITQNTHEKNTKIPPKTKFLFFFLSFIKLKVLFAFYSRFSFCYKELAIYKCEL
jgi:hypothetical protein